MEWTDGLIYRSKVLGLKWEDVYQVWAVWAGRLLLLTWRCHLSCAPLQAQLSDSAEEKAFESDFV